MKVLVACEEIIGALKDAIEEMDGEQTVAVPVLFLKDVYRLLTEEETQNEAD